MITIYAMRAYATARSLVWQSYLLVCSVLRSKMFWMAASPVLGAVAYYFYLHNLYVIDEVLEGEKLRELTLDEKFVLRVVAPYEFSHLKDFVESYSLCPCIYELQVLYQAAPYPLPTADSFTYTHTHSKVKVVNVPSNEVPPYISDLPLDTKAVLLMDVGVTVSCDDLAFTHSVWRSANVPVGFIPRYHRLEKLPLDTFSQYTTIRGDKLLTSWSDESFAYYGGMHVWWYGQYSIVTSKAIMISSYEMKKLSSSPLVRSLLLHDMSCQSILPSVWSTKDGSAAPIWVKVPFIVDINAKPHYAANAKPHYAAHFEPSSNHSSNGLNVDWTSLMKIPTLLSGSNKKYSACVSGLLRALGGKKVAYSAYKSVRASSLLFW